MPPTLPATFLYNFVHFSAMESYVPVHQGPLSASQGRYGFANVTANFEENGHGTSEADCAIRSVCTADDHAVRHADVCPDRSRRGMELAISRRSARACRRSRSRRLFRPADQRCRKGNGRRMESRYSFGARTSM